ncbi:MAG: hypothetical protein QXU75_00500 [Candidatus Methanomethylicaceae archaeon]
MVNGVYWRPWCGPCRCGFGPHAYGYWYRAPPLEELEAMRNFLEKEFEDIRREIDRIKSEKRQEG